MTSDPTATQNGRIRRVPPRSLIVLLACALPAVLVGRLVIQAVVSLNGLAASPTPYFVPGEALLLYIAAPLITLSACALFLAPGLIVSLRFTRIDTLPRWILAGFTLSFAAVSLAAMAGQAIIRQPLIGVGFASLILALSAVPLLFGMRGRRSSIAPPLGRADTAALITALALAAIVVVALLPKLFWENFTSEGALMFETARLMLHQPLPFWSDAAGEVANFPGMKSMLALYPTSWFVRLFGDNEAAARLPYVLLLIVLFCAMVNAIEEGLARRMRAVELALLGVGLLLVTLVMAFSATEDPYNADLALPAVQDLLLMIFWCGFMVHFQRRDGGWMFVYFALAYLTAPGALPLLGAWWLAAMAVVRPRPRNRFGLIAAAVVALVIGEFVAVKLLAFVGMPNPRFLHGTGDLVKGVLDPQVSQVIRFAWAFVPVGLLPAAALVAWRWQDGTTRMIAVCGLLMFAFYYFQHRFALHDFVPVMVLSLVVLWRTLVGSPESARRILLPATGILLLVGFVLSWPSDFRPAIGSREVGAQIDDRTDGYTWSDAAAFGRSDLLQTLFPPPEDPRVPKQLYGGDALVWLHYAHERTASPHPRNYVLQSKLDPPVPGARKIAENASVALYVRDENAWHAQAARLLPDPTASRLYVIPRDTLFLRNGGSAAGPPKP